MYDRSVALELPRNVSTLVAKIVETHCTFHVFLSKVNNIKEKLYSVHKIVTSSSLSVSSAHD